MDIFTKKFFAARAGGKMGGSGRTLSRIGDFTKI